MQILQAFVEAKPVDDSSRSKAIQVLSVLQVLLLPAPRRQVLKPCIQFTAWLHQGRSRIRCEQACHRCSEILQVVALTTKHGLAVNPCHHLAMHKHWHLRMCNPSSISSFLLLKYCPAAPGAHQLPEVSLFMLA